MPPLISSMEMTSKDGKRFLVRPMAGDDMSEVRTLLGDRLDEAQNGRYVLVAVMDDQVVGAICCVEFETTLLVFIVRVAVRPEYRRRRVGSTLVDMAIQSVHDAYHGPGWCVLAETEDETLGDKLMASSFREDLHPGLQSCGESNAFVNSWRLRK